MTRTELANRLIRRAGEMILSTYGTITNAREKKANDYVTETDLAIEDMYRKEIRAVFPDDGFLGEERGREDGTSGFTWIFDPLDGTNNFTRGIRLSGTILAIQYGNEVREGYIHLPYENELYYAHKGEGAYCLNLSSGQSAELHVSNRPLEHYMIVGDAWQDHELYLEEQPFWTALHQLFPNVRGFYCAAYHFAYIASGKAEMTFSPINNPWDIAAGCLIVEEAGGRVTDYHGNATEDYTRSIIVSNGVAHDKVVEILRPYKSKRFDI